jgi:thioredoxin reductase (NADPH)
LQTGEYLVHEGDGRALFVVLEGRLETTNVVDGVERVIGGRAAGELIGEVPMVLGTPFPASFRAALPSRVMRVEPREFQAILVIAPDVWARVGALARERIEGLQEMADDEPAPQATVIGERYDDACRELRQFLDRNGISFDWVTPAEAHAGACAVDTSNVGEVFPAVIFHDGNVLAHPEKRELARRLGLTTVPALAEYDTVIIGGGPAGLAAAVYGASEGLTTLMVEQEAPGGQAGTSSRIEIISDFQRASPATNSPVARSPKRNASVAEILVTRRVESLDAAKREVRFDGDEAVRAKTVILATAVSWRKLDLDGIDRLTGRGIYYGASRSDAISLTGLDVYLVGAGNSAGQAAMYFSGYARSVTLVVRGDSLAKSMSHYLITQLQSKSNVFVRLNSEVTAVYGTDHLDAIELTSKGVTERVEAAGLYIFIGATAETSWLPPEIERDKLGYVTTGDDATKSGRWTLERPPYLLETSVPGIFAAGGVRCRSIKRVASGVGEGSMSIRLRASGLASRPSDRWLSP